MRALASPAGPRMVAGAAAAASTTDAAGPAADAAAAAADRRCSLLKRTPHALQSVCGPVRRHRGGEGKRFTVDFGVKVGSAASPDLTLLRGIAKGGARFGKRKLEGAPFSCGKCGCVGGCGWVT
eukprot:366360-Chlamydomonas_euryale.AAC.1